MALQAFEFASQHICAVVHAGFVGFIEVH